MRLYKRILKSDAFMGCAAFLAWAYIRFVHMTCRWRVYHDHIIESYVLTKTPVIVVFWHNRLFLNALGWTYPVPFYMLISQHSDGQLISRVMQHFGISTIKGSTNRGGAEALRRMLKTLKNGDCLGVTPDGPRGPRFQCSDGIVSLARLSGCDVIPGISASGRRKVLGSWDRFILALPFSRAAFVWGQPLSLKKDATAEEIASFKAKLEQNLMDTCDQADAYVGQAPVR